MIENKKLKIEELINIVNNNKYVYFLKDEKTQMKDILESQKPFFFAVDIFKHFLEDTVVALINSPQYNYFTFIKLIENINEEYGRVFQGKQYLVLDEDKESQLIYKKLLKFDIDVLKKDSSIFKIKPELAHSQTFMIFLKSLGLQENENLVISYPVKNWIEKVQFVINSNIKENNIHNILLYLSGIEFYYAIMSKYIEEKVSQLPLHCEQTHYKKHSELDLQHGQELLDSAINCNIQSNNFEYFYKGVKDFNNLYNEMI